MEMHGIMASAEEDMRLERRLAKKLKVKSGRLTNANDDMDMLLEGIPSVTDDLGKIGKEDKNEYLATDYPKKKFETSRLLKKHGNSSSSEHGQEVSGPPKTVSSEVGVDRKYVAPQLRSRGGNELAEYAEVRRRLRGLLNRISETNVESITGEISALFQSVGRAVGTQIVSEEIVSSCSGGPRGNEQLSIFVSSLDVPMFSPVCS